MQSKKLQPFPWENLLDWYTENGRHDLPWRTYKDIKNMEVSAWKEQDILVYRVWLSEILLQQTQASRVVDFFNRMVERFPTVALLAQTDYETFFPYYQWLGYYSRARNILKTAKVIHEQYGWIFPIEKDKLVQLPGVWPYTAEAIRAFGYGIPTLSWDTNLEKVFARYYHGTRNERLSKEEKEWVQEDLERFINQHANSDENSEMGVRGNLAHSINNALMDFAAMVDLKNPTNINWSDYPIQSGKFYETRGSLEPQETKKAISFPTPDATIIVTLHENHRVYYSENIEEYEPFTLPPSLNRNTREYIKSYFREKYNLELSVRPPHKKWLSEDGRPYIAVNTQVQTGENSFAKYKKPEKK